MEASADGTYAPLETGRLGRKESASSAGSTKGDLKVPFALALPGAPTPEKSHRAIVSSPRTGLHHTWQRGWFSRFSYGNLPTTLPAKSMASENRLNAWQRIALYPVATRLANAAFHWMRNQLVRNAPGERLQRQLVSATSSVKEQSLSLMLPREVLTSSQANASVQFQGAVLTTDMKVMMNKIARKDVYREKDLRRIVSAPQQLDYIETVHISIDLSRKEARERLISILNYYRVENLVLEGASLAAASQLLPELRQKNMTLLSCSPHEDVQDYKEDWNYMVSRNSFFKHLLERVKLLRKLSREEVFELEVLTLSSATKYCEDRLIKNELDKILEEIQTVAAQHRASPNSSPTQPLPKQPETPASPHSKTATSSAGSPRGIHASSSAPYPNTASNGNAKHPRPSPTEPPRRDERQESKRIVDSTPKKPHEILGVAQDASEADIKKAYRKLALKYHPDKNPDNPAAEEQFKTVAQAFEAMTNPDNRQDTPMTMSEAWSILRRMQEEDKLDRVEIKRQGAAIEEIRIGIEKVQAGIEEVKARRARKAREAQATSSAPSPDAPSGTSPLSDSSGQNSDSDRSSSPEELGDTSPTQGSPPTTPAHQPPPPAQNGANTLAMDS